MNVTMFSPYKIRPPLYSKMILAVHVLNRKESESFLIPFKTRYFFKYLVFMLYEEGFNMVEY